MSEQKYTPGPWKIGNHGSVVTDVPDPQVEIVGENAQDTIDWYGGHVICETVTNSNAVLIAAAPELLEALRVIVNGIVTYPGEFNADSEIVTIARAAIAKAEATQ